MNFGSVCSGIEAASVAWHPLGWRTAWVAEIDPFCCSLLKHHYPEVHNYGDFTTIDDSAEPVDVLVGGTPCQDFSVAGLRAGLDGERGQLTIEFARLAARKRPRWLVWENVPGVLSIDGGRAFGAFLGLLGKLGYGFAYRVLDAQYFGVPQRRRRVFVVGHLGDWRRAAAVLFERHGLSGHPAPSRKARETVTALTSNGVGTCGADDNQAQGGHLIASTGQTSHCLNAGGMGRIDYETETLICPTLRSGGNQTGGDRPPGTDVDTCESLIVTHSLRADGFDASEDGTGRGTPLVPVHCFDARQSDVIQYGDKTGPLDTDGFTHALAFNLRGRDSGSQAEVSDVASVRAASGGSSRSYVSSSAVRRLLPSECESLQGFPRGYTAVPYRGKPAADGPRYKALGNSMAVPVMQWLGQRIQMVEDIGK